MYIIVYTLSYWPNIGRVCSHMLKRYCLQERLRCLKERLQLMNENAPSKEKTIACAYIKYCRMMDEDSERKTA